MARFLGDDWQKQVPSETCKLTAPGLQAPPSPLLLDPWDVLEQLHGVLDGRDAEVANLTGSLVGFAETIRDDGTVDSSDEAAKSFFGCVRRIRESTLMAADVAFSFQQSGWGNSQGSCALQGLLGDESAGSRLADCGHDVVRVLSSNERLGDLVASGRWKLISDTAGAGQAVDPLLAGLTMNGRVMADSVLAARPRRGLAPAVPTSQVRELLTMLANWHTMGDRIRLAEESAAEMEHELDMFGPDLKDVEEMDSLKESIAKLETELQRCKTDAVNKASVQEELRGVLQERDELIERLTYWEEQVVSAQSVQAGLNHVRTQVRGQTAALELAREDLEEAQAELTHQKNLVYNVTMQISTLKPGLAAIRGEEATQTPEAAAATAMTDEASMKPSAPQTSVAPTDLGDTPWPAAAAELLRIADKAIHMEDIFGERDASQMVQTAIAEAGPDSLRMSLAAGAAGVALLLLGVPFKWGVSHDLITRARRVYYSWNGPSHSMVFMLTCLEGAAAHMKNGDGQLSIDAAEAAIKEAISRCGPDSSTVGDANISAGLALLLGNEKDKGLQLISEGLRIKTSCLGPSHPAVSLCRAMYSDYQRWLP